MSSHLNSEVLDPSEEIFAWPTAILDEDLCKPTLVTIQTVHKGEKKSFIVPRALITTKSEYFRKAFQSGFSEAQRKEITLEDDGFATKILLAYYCIGSIPVESTFARLQRQSPKRKRSSDSSEVKAKRSCLDEEAAIPAAVEATEAAGEQQDQLEDAAPVVDLDSHENDPMRPVTWSWSKLFELYVFSDKYDTSILRKQIFFLIQMKFLMDYPRRYAGPSFRETRRIIGNLPSSSPLYRFVVDIWALDLHLIDDDEEREWLGRFPSSFLVDCFMASRKLGEARGCCSNKLHECGHHASDDGMAVRGRDPCLYHDHQYDDEKTEDFCRSRWTHFLSKYCN